MNRLLSWCAGILLTVAATSVSALPGTFSIAQIFSNADGTVQFVQIRDRGMSDCDAHEELWSGLTLTSFGAAPQRQFTFPNNLPTCETSGKQILIATQGFAALGLVAPDYVMPNGFVQMTAGTLAFAGISEATYAALPNDGVHALAFPSGTVIQNVATNLAGVAASVTSGASAFTPVGGVWWNPNESGSGYGLDFKDGVLLVQIYSYLAGGPAQWYLAAGAVTNNVFTATLDKYTGGQCISCAYKGPTLTGNDGQVTITFTSATTANVSLPGGRQIQIQRYFQPPAVVAPAPAITPVGGVWWNPNESGSGYGLDFQNGVLLVQIYSYLAGGPAQWYLAAGGVAANTFTATLDKYTDGQCISCTYKGPALAGNDGQTTFTFTSPTTANVTLPGGRQIQIQRYFQP